MKYVFFLPGLALAVFACAFLYISTGNMIPRYIGICFGLILAVMMFFYYREKVTAGLALRRVSNLDDFSDAVMIGQAFFLEDRMLGYGNRQVFDLTYDRIRSVTYETDQRGRMFLNLETDQGVLPVEMALKDQAKRVAMFLKTKNPGTEIRNIEASGEGTLHSIDPYRNEKK
jgi:hypothetical protein